MIIEILESKNLLCSLVNDDLLVDLLTQEYPTIEAVDCPSPIGFRVLSGVLNDDPPLVARKVDSDTLQLLPTETTRPFTLGEPGTIGQFPDIFRVTYFTEEFGRQDIPVTISYRSDHPEKLEVLVNELQQLAGVPANIRVGFVSNDMLFKDLGQAVFPYRVWIDDTPIDLPDDHAANGIPVLFTEARNYSLVIEHPRTALQRDIIRTEFTIRVTLPILPGDYNRDGFRDVQDIDDVTRDVLEGKTASFERDFVLRELNASPGDANLDGIFDSKDLIEIFQAGKFEKVEVAGWGEGDWNGDGIFNTADLIAAFVAGRYEQD